MISNDSLLTTDFLAGLNEEERKLALEILKQYSEDGTSSLLDQCCSILNNCLFFCGFSYAMFSYILKKSYL